MQLEANARMMFMARLIEVLRLPRLLLPSIYAHVQLSLRLVLDYSYLS